MVKCLSCGKVWYPSEGEESTCICDRSIEQQFQESLKNYERKHK